MKKIKFPAISFASISSFLAGLHRRERLAIYGALVALILFCMVQFLIFPLIDKRASLQSRITAERSNLVEIHKLKSEYESLTRINRQTDARLKNRPKNFSLIPFLNDLAGKSGIEQNIVYMKPSTSNIRNSSYTLEIVELKLQALTMEQVITFLHGIELSGNQVWVKRMSVTRDDKIEGTLNTTIQAETFR